MLSRRVVHTFLLWCAFAFLAVSNAFATEYHGQVTFNGLPVPGATLTAAQGDKKLVAVSDAQGVYSFADWGGGHDFSGVGVEYDHELASSAAGEKTARARIEC